MKLCPIRTNFETTINKSINHTKFVYRWQETFKMGLHTAKCRLPINSCYKFSFFSRYFYIKKWQLSIFFLFKGKRHVWMTSIKIITKFREVFSRFEENKNVINTSSVKNWFKFLRTLFKPFDLIKWQESICHSRSKRRSHDHAILLFIKNIIKYEIRFLSSQRQKVLKLRFIYTLYNILIIIKQIGAYINGLFKRYISKKWVNIKAAHEKFAVLMYNLFSKSKIIFYGKFIKRNWREFRN